MAAYVLNISCSPYNSFEKRNIRVQIKCTLQGQAEPSEEDTAGLTSVFAYRRINGEYCFDHVCSTVDMVDYPIIGTEETGESFKWARSDTVDILVRTLSIAQDFIYDVKSDVKLLYLNMCAHDQVVGTDTFYIGDNYTLDIDENSDPIEICTIPFGYDYSLVAPDNGGTLSKQDNKIYYTPRANTFGQENFSYTLINTENVPITYTYTVTIAKNAEKGFVQEAITRENTPVNISYTTVNFGDWFTPGSILELNVYPLNTRKGTVEKVDSTTLRYTPGPELHIGDDDDFDYRVTNGKRTAVIHCVVNINE